MRSSLALRDLAAGELEIRHRPSARTGPAFPSVVRKAAPRRLPWYRHCEGLGGPPDVSLWLHPVAVEQATTGDADDYDNDCLAFSSQIIP